MKRKTKHGWQKQDQEWSELKEAIKNLCGSCAPDIRCVNNKYITMVGCPYWKHGQPQIEATKQKEN